MLQDFAIHALRALIAVVLSTTLLDGVHSSERPNILVILTDDQGWGDLSLHGNTNLETPHLDSLAHDGAQIDYFYVCPVCAPTRAEFLTGRYHPRTGVSGVSRGEGRINADETTIADVFKAAGYATGCFGKWHNGTQPPLHPNDRGFDEFYGFTSGHWGHYFSPPLDQNGSHVRGNGFIVDDITDHALQFIDSNRNNPFFCYVPLNTPHSPMMVPDRFYQKFDGFTPEMKHRDPQKEDVMMTRAALALCENIDWNVGRMLSQLDKAGLAQETIVVFFSDNGPNSYRWNGGFKGRKGSLDEGGVRSPCFVRWPRKISAGTRVTNIAGAIDLLPTLADLAGIPVKTTKPIDGLSLTPLLTGQATEWPDRLLFSFRSARNQVSVRSERFRLDNSGRLFDISKDPGQRNDVSAGHPEITARLKAKAAKQRKITAQLLEASKDRPFHVGFGKNTRLPARDGVPNGNIQRSSKAPNNSFFTNWTASDDFITWDVHVKETAMFEATVYYTCSSDNVGCNICLSDSRKSSVTQTVTEAFDPPLYKKPFERVEKSHYFVKDFRALRLGRLELPAGRATLKLSADGLRNGRAIDVHSIELRRVD